MEKRKGKMERERERFTSVTDRLTNSQKEAGRQTFQFIHHKFVFYVKSNSLEEVFFSGSMLQKAPNSKANPPPPQIKYNNRNNNRRK